jgi:hypothetical protein
MKYKKPKNISYKKLNRKPIPKPLLITGIVITSILVVALLVLATIAIINSVEIAKIEKFNAQLKEIQIAHNPNKLTYYCDTPFDSTGLMVYSLTNGGAFTKLDLDDCTITGFDSSAPVEDQVITVTYKGFTATFTVDIKEEQPTIPMLESITMETLPKTEYKVGEGLNSDGDVFVCTYTDGTTKKVDLINEYVYGFRAAYLAGVGEYDITVKYSEEGIQVETTYKITISE